MTNDYEDFKGKVLKLTGLDLSSYKERQMKRRIDSLIKRHGHSTYDTFVLELSKNKELFNEFMNYLTINVSEFYRNPGQWEILEKEVVPELLKHNKNLKIWSAACSTGEEPYSLTMMMSRFMDLSKVKIMATDIDDGAIAKAKAGVYSSKSLVNLPKDFVDNYFTKNGDNYAISDKIKSRVEFKKQNLLADKYTDSCDLIVCRNVMIYFTEEAKSEMYTKFREALGPNGVLFVGSTEQIIMPNRYKLDPMKTFFYKRSQKTGFEIEP